MNYPIIDTHCHLGLFIEPEKIAQKMKNQNGYIIAVTNLPSHYKISQPYVKAHKNVRLSLGLHPLSEKSHTNYERELFVNLIDSTSYIGEIGLDFSRAGIKTKEVQMETLKFVLKKIKNKNKIISIHSRGAEKIVLNLLIENNVNKGIFHWYSGNNKLIHSIIDAGYYFSVNSFMISSNKGRDIISCIPKDRILTESDGPYTRNKTETYPTEIKKVINYFSKTWEKPIEDVNCLLYENFMRIVKK